MVDTRLGWITAKKHADNLVTDGNLSRVQHLDIFHRFLKSRHDQDHRIALALLRSFIRNYPDDFDSDISPDDLIKYGNKLCRLYHKDFGREILYQVMWIRHMPAIWIDRIADDEPEPLRHAFAIALGELAKSKRISLDRTLGILRYFLDEPGANVRESLVEAMKIIWARDPERLHYFLVAHEKDAGSHRMALINATRENIS